MAQNTEKWGRQKARERYGKPTSAGMKAADKSEPQSPEDKRGPDYDNDHRDDWIRGVGESAEGKPSFDKA